jgi:diaminohydroxyphosphoribosylaminopyrimidine deaminase/5-amino-6-(5-phosphoribosylamino)uracil reductase
MDEAPVWLLAGRAAPPARCEALEDAGVKVLRIDEAGKGIDLRDGVSSLWREGVRSILCEGGGSLAGSLMADGLVQRLYLVVAPAVLGPEGVPALTAAIGDWRVVEARRLGSDGLLVLEPGPGSER